MCVCVCVCVMFAATDGGGGGAAHEDTPHSWRNRGKCSAFTCLSHIYLPHTHTHTQAPFCCKRKNFTLTPPPSPPHLSYLDYLQWYRSCCYWYYYYYHHYYHCLCLQWYKSCCYWYYYYYHYYYHYRHHCLPQGRLSAQQVGSIVSSRAQEIAATSQHYSHLQQTIVVRSAAVLVVVVIGVIVEEAVAVPVML